MTKKLEKNAKDHYKFNKNVKIEQNVRKLIRKGLKMTKNSSQC